MEYTYAFVFVFINSLFYIDAQDVETVLAKQNIDGYPSALLFESISKNQNEAGTMDKLKIAELLESKEVQATLTRSALDYSARNLNKSGQARYLMDDAGLCGYSWVSWLSWMGCEAQEAKDQKPSSLPLIMESSYSCYSRS